MCNIVPKVLDNSSRSIKEIKENLRKRFKIDLSEQEIIEIMGELVARDIAAKVDVGWVKT